ncbi:MAG: helix-turn-helix domain-containing protein [Actinomycetota bacterium]
MAEERTEPTGVQATTAMLKAMAHPIRRRILRLLPRRTFVRAADVAEELGEPANKVSFHLRVLADAGLIVEAPEQARDRRDRVWTYTKRALTIGGPGQPVADEQLGNVVIAGLVEEHQDLVRRLLAWSPEYVAGRTTEIHGTFIQRTLRLTPTEFEKLLVALQEVMQAADDAHDPADPDSRSWELDIVAADDSI